MIKDIPYLNAEDLPKVPFVINGISSRFIRENKIIPIEMKNNILKVIMADPEDSATVSITLKVASLGGCSSVPATTTRLRYLSVSMSRKRRDINRIIEDLE